ncbi:MAG: methylenetetrahydrofolate--tRNA-(uracil(54)-C(5))-methyltransferase (FADH(2)-oxidizing) TrmFO [Candidatus Gastranaerophilales bacterium]|nr:methylenetetrahydrofolate--tRNA-(uracil(54)-C(5))-methyltransferase (FADH(2)-oxidizing) TrmFO [Candidatus Gastranaerophilales bacterium]
MKLTIIGAGLAGSEAALQAANSGIEVDLYEMRPEKTTGAHKTSKPAELVCSNSLGSFDETVASGLLKAELKILNSYLIKTAFDSQVPAGAALAVDREGFSQKIQDMLEAHPNINFIRKEITKIPENETVLIASGPLTSEVLAREILTLTGENQLKFFDAIAPIVEKSSINFDIAFYQNRYGKGTNDYINCPMNREQYENFYKVLINAPKIELKNFEKKFFESCLPIEVLASRGVDTLRFGPMKPVGLVDERTKEENYAVVQLRQDDKAGELYNLVGFQTNLKWGAQKELIQTIPGLENANIVRYGVMHANTFINSPKILNPTMNMRKYPNIFFAGQLTGTEGYTEAIATGLLAGKNAVRFLKNEPLIELPETTMLGALTHYISFEGQEHFQPVNSNWGIINKDGIDRKILKNKKAKTEVMSKRALNTLNDLISAL